MSEFQIDQIVGKNFERSLAVREANLDEQARTVELAFSSAEPVMHWFGYLILDHSENSIRLDRLRETGALLWAHDTREQIGAVEDIRLDSSAGICRAVCKFSRGECGEENFQDVRDGIKRSVSFGFMIHALEPQVDQNGNHMEIDGEYVYVSRDWEPYEISLVSVPADISVGVGRSLESDKIPASTDANPKNERNEEMKKDEIPATPDNEPNEAAIVQSDAVKRAREFEAFGSVYGEVELARTLSLDPAKTVEDLRQAILDKRSNQTVVPPAPVSDVAKRSGAPATAIPATSAYRGQLKSFKGADAELRAYRSGQFLRAVLLGDHRAEQYCREHGLFERAHSGVSNATGGVLVPDEFENTIIDLRIQYGVFRANAQVVPMGSDSQTRPRRTSGLTAYFVGDEDSITESNKGWDSVTLLAKELGVLTKYSNNLGDDAVISLADDLAGEIGYAFAQKEDECGFNGDGTSTYGNIVGLKTLVGAATAGVATAAGSTFASVTLANMNSLMGLLPQYARRAGGNKIYCSYAVYANVLTRIAQAVGGVTYGEIAGALSNQFFGIPVEIVEVMPASASSGAIIVYYGNLAQGALFGDRRGVTVEMTNAHDTDFAKRLISIRGTQRFDINVHNPGDTTNAGSIVALKLA